MLKNLSNLGTTLNKQELQSINGGALCLYWDYQSLLYCQYYFNAEDIECDPTVECEAEP